MKIATLCRVARAGGGLFRDPVRRLAARADARARLVADLFFVDL
jgi:hypothetical protein